MLIIAAQSYNMTKMIRDVTLVSLSMNLFEVMHDNSASGAL
jgi:hypothetical protein